MKMVKTLKDSNGLTHTQNMKNLYFSPYMESHSEKEWQMHLGYNKTFT